MEKLKQLREETKTKREAKESLKAKRKAQLAARLEKVRQRRIAQGLPVPELKGMYLYPLFNWLSGLCSSLIAFRSRFMQL